MTFRNFLRFIFTFAFAVCFLGFQPAHTAASNARIIRLSLVQGDVRVLRDSKGDPLANDKANWERAELNLPIRQHYVVATDHGRAEVEFENGAMAFIGENSVLEFFDLSLEDGALTFGQLAERLTQVRREVERGNWPRAAGGNCLNLKDVFAAKFEAAPRYHDTQ